MSNDLLAGIGFSILCAALGAIWWEIRGLRKNSHSQSNHITVLYGRVGLLDHRVNTLENQRRGE